MTLPLPPQALDLLKSLDNKLSLTDAVFDVVDARKTAADDPAVPLSLQLLLRGRDGKERSISLTDFGEFETRRGQQMYGLFVDDTAVLLLNPHTRKHLLPNDADARRKRAQLVKALGPLDIVQIVMSFATDPELPGGGSRALRELSSNVDKIHAERQQRKPIPRIVKLIGLGVLACVVGAGVYVGVAYFWKDLRVPSRPGGTTLVNYLDQVQLTLDDTRSAVLTPGAAPVCELMGSIYNRMGRKVDKLNFVGRVRGTAISFSMEGIEKGAAVRGVVIGRHAGPCLPNYKSTYELSEPDCVFDAVAWKGCRDVIRILF